MSYEILDPDKLYRGKSYSSWAQDWFNWLLTADADKHNFGPVAFLRANLMPNSTTEYTSVVAAPDIKNDNTVDSTYNDDLLFPRNYVNNPNVRVGADKLQIYQDQAVFWPIITAYEVATKPYVDWGLMQDTVGSIIDYGDNPPDTNAINIDDKPIKPPIEIEKFRISTSVFTVIVPDTGYGRSVKDFLEMNLPAGQYPAMIEGYFIMLKFTELGTHSIYSRAMAPRERIGPYVAELLYQIDVNVRPVTPLMEAKKRTPPFRSARHEGIITRILSEKIEKYELTPKDANNLMHSSGLGRIFDEKKKGPK